MPSSPVEAIFATPAQLASGVLLLCVVLLLASTLVELVHRLVPSALALLGSGLGLVAHSALPAGNGFLASQPGGLGLLPPLAALCGLIVFGLPLCRLRLLAGSDLKMLAVAGAFLGPVEILWALYFTALSSGALALLWLWRADALPMPIAGQRRSKGNWPESSLPHGLAIALGCIIAIVYRGRAHGLL